MSRVGPYRSLGGFALGAIVAALVLPSAAFPASDGLSETEAQQVLLDAKARAVAIDAQARALAGLAWPDEPGDPLVQSLAREELMNFGELGMEALRAAATSVRPLYRADVVATLIAAQRRVRAGIPLHFLPGLDEAIWAGTAEARRLAIREVARFRYFPAMLTIIDAATAEPRVRREALVSLGRLGDDRAWNFLAEVLDGGTIEEQRLAAAALTQLGDRGREVLRKASRSTARVVREIAVTALLPRATLDDLSALHEFIGEHADDDPLVVGAARERAAFLESLLALEDEVIAGPSLEP